MKAKPKMKQSDKQVLVDSLRGKLGTDTTLYYTDFTGLNVKRMTELRRRLRKVGVEYVVIKNTLALRAVNESGLVSQELKGPTGIIVAKDAVSGAKVLTDFAKENDQKPSVKGGIYEGKSIDAAHGQEIGLAPNARRSPLDLRRLYEHHPDDVRPRPRSATAQLEGSNEIPQASA